MVLKWGVAGAGVVALWLLVLMQLDWAPLGKIDVYCGSVAHEAECWFTNRSAFEGRACTRVKLVSRSGGQAVESLPVCSGRLEPGSTRSLRVPWVKGRPIDVCSRSTAPAELDLAAGKVVGGRDGERELSWKACKLEIEEL